ncbi:unnamed protein product [Urochloa humidicola]
MVFFNCILSNGKKRLFFKAINYCIYNYYIKMSVHFKTLLGVLWTLWKSRNELVFQDKVTPAPEVVIHRIVVQLKYWRPLLKQKRR